jgi:hypothetical protein
MTCGSQFRRKDSTISPLTILGNCNSSIHMLMTDDFGGLQPFVTLSEKRTFIHIKFQMGFKYTRRTFNFHADGQDCLLSCVTSKSLPETLLTVPSPSRLRMIPSRMTQQVLQPLFPVKHMLSKLIVCHQAS